MPDLSLKHIIDLKGDSEVVMYHRCRCEGCCDDKYKLSSMLSAKDWDTIQSCSRCHQITSVERVHICLIYEELIDAMETANSITLPQKDQSRFSFSINGLELSTIRNPFTDTCCEIRPISLKSLRLIA